MTATSTTAVSAPGKVLVAGGYLVLDRAYTGLVFGLDARIHVAITDISISQAATSEVIVRSPQFKSAEWQYRCNVVDHDSGVEITQSTITPEQPLNRNPFVETTLRYVLSYINTVRSQGTSLPCLAITILADNDYYTTPAEVQTGEKFHRFGIPLSNAHKTGLGSSAALVTALTAALLNHLLPNNFGITTHASQQRLHNLAQAAHCAAQGKVGSGFDVASAVFGSCIYRRFSPAILSSLPDPGTLGFATKLREVVDDDDDDDKTNTKWDTEIRKNEVVVPNGLRMVMCDVSCGSQTPGMVKKVLSWRSNTRARADEIWSRLHAANLNLASELRHVADTKTAADYTRLTASFDAIRQEIRLMGRESDVPIEPPAQTRLIDACCKVPGVIGGTVPGAGGYDAIVLLIQDRQQVIDELLALFKDWQFGAEAGEGKVSMLGVREEMEGVRSEDTASYGNWLR